MRRHWVLDVRPGMVVGKGLHNERGDILLQAGTVLTEHHIRRLVEKGFAAMYVRDGLADDVEPPDLISQRVRSAAVQTLYHLQQMARQSIGNLSALSTRELRAAASDPAVLRVLEHGPSLQALAGTAENILDEVAETDVLTGVSALKSHDNYTFEHSVDTAVVGAILGRRLGFHRSALRTLVLGCLLHDIGKLFIGPAILNKAGALTTEEWAQIRLHPALGYELLRRMKLQSPLVKFAVGQHHERQDGAGYPKGFRGRNRLPTAWHEQPAEGEVLPIAEIAAVCDVYAALTSDRPYRPAKSASETIGILQELAGNHLNAPVVERLLSALPPFPLASPVLIAHGEFAGRRGVVVKLHRGRLDRPTVRLVADAQGDPIEPVEIDLGQTDTQLVAVDDLAVPAEPVRPLAPAFRC